MAKRVAATTVAKVSKASGKNALERACERAAASGLIVAGRGFRKSDHALVWFVPSQHETNRWYQVTQIEGQLECACAAGQYGRLCIHRAVVYLDLTAEAASFAATQRNHAEASATLARVEARLDADDAARASAPLARDNRPFSLFKAS